MKWLSGSTTRQCDRTVAQPHRRLAPPPIPLDTTSVQAAVERADLEVVAEGDSHPGPARAGPKGDKGDKGDKGEPADAGGMSDEMASIVRGLQAQVAQLQAAVAENAAGDAEVGLGLLCVWTCLAPEHMLWTKIPNGSKLSEPDKSKRIIGLGRIVVAGKEAPIVLANLL